MTKTKAQLRAEAVERLKDTHIDTGSAVKKLAAAIGSEWNPPSVNYSLGCLKSKLIDLLTDDAHESRGSYEERLYDVPVSDCPYCGCERVVIHDFNDIYEKPHSYRVEHIDEKEAFNAGCFESYLAFDSVEKAVEHANMSDLLTDEERETDVTDYQDGSNDGMERESGVSDSREKISRTENVESVHQADLSDTREKLEEDVWRYFHIEWNRDYHVFDDVCNDVKAWLNRQAAITCAEILGSSRSYARQLANTSEDEELMDAIDELQSKVDTVEKERNYWKLHTDCWADKCKELEAKVGKLEVKLDNAYEKNRSLRLHISKMQSGRNGWHVKAKQLDAENEQLREKLSRAYDNAHDTLRMMD